MTETIEVNCSDYQRFIAAAEAVARPELDKIVQKVVADLQEQSSTGLFEEIHARNQWDEYCWQLQSGPYDDGFSEFGSITGAFNELRDGLIVSEFEKLPKYIQLFLSLHASAMKGNLEDFGIMGAILEDAVIEVVGERLNEMASERDLDFIGPDRDDRLAMEIHLQGLAGDALSYGDGCSEFIMLYVDELLSGTPEDVTAMSDALLDIYMGTLINDLDEGGQLAAALLDKFDRQIRALVLECDIRPAIEEAVAEAQACLDG